MTLFIGFFIKNSPCGIFMGVMLQKLVFLKWAYSICRKSLMWLHVPARPCHANAMFSITLLSISCLSYDDVFLRYL